MQAHEPCFYGWRKGKIPELIPPNNAQTVWQVNMVEIEGNHPTEKPLELFARPIAFHTAKGQICYEPFSGSGTNMVACEKSERVCFSMELSPPFIAVALERMADMGLKPRLAKS